MGLPKCKYIENKYERAIFRFVLHQSNYKRENGYKKNCIRMKIIRLLTSMFLCTIIMSSCTKDPSVNTVDMEENEWRLCRIATSSGFFSEIPSIQWHWEPPADRFVLSFNKESNIARMFLVANWWVARYSIYGQDSISLRGSTTSMMGYTGDEIWIEDTLNAYGTEDYRFYICGDKLVLSSGSITLEFVLSRHG